MRYVPEAQAVHQHLPFAVPDLIRRAAIYGQTQLALLRKHPTLLGSRQRKQGVEDLAATLTRIDSLDFAPFFTMKKGDGTVADEITKLFRRAAPDV